MHLSPWLHWGKVPAEERTLSHQRVLTPFIYTSGLSEGILRCVKSYLHLFILRSNNQYMAQCNLGTLCMAKAANRKSPHTEAGVSVASSVG